MSAKVESESLDYWKWFLTQLGDDLELYSNSDFTFITDRHKGLLPAIKTLFPAAEHRYCVRHINQNMNLQWKGGVFKDLLWRAATSTTTVYFDKAMDELKAYMVINVANCDLLIKTTLLPPKVVVPVGRPSKKRKRSAGEVETLVISGKIGRKGLQVSCSSCKGKGHNKRGCKANASNQQPSQGNATEVNASGSQPQPSQGFMGTPSARTPSATTLSARTPSATTLSASTPSASTPSTRTPSASTSGQRMTKIMENMKFSPTKKA
ncbi:mutator type transposase [Tanacetum coccineum]|uniref:Mutator type transposase n=1 Tax=Tanacetum coccineum TaxID=301880 RepID=A0ABQ5A644_9ASTR